MSAGHLNITLRNAVHAHGLQDVVGRHGVDRQHALTRIAERIGDRREMHNSVEPAHAIPDRLAFGQVDLQKIHVWKRLRGASIEHRHRVSSLIRRDGGEFWPQRKLPHLTHHEGGEFWRQSKVWGSDKQWLQSKALQ